MGRNLVRIPVKLPPGMFGNGTRGQAAGRVRGGSLSRFFDGAWGPIGGWRRRAPQSGLSVVTGKARTIFGWRPSSTAAWVAIGTHSNLYVQSESALIADITPTGLVTGRADASAGGGYGRGFYGRGTYDSPRLTKSVLAASMWSFDSWGSDVVGVQSEDGRAWTWQLNPANKATAVPNAPTCTALVVTPERALMLLAAGGNPRRVAWSDWENYSSWTASALNKAGNIDLQTAGILLAGRVVRNRTLIWTDIDLWTCTKRAGLLVYEFDKAGERCGAISRNAMAVYGDKAVWMGLESFHGFDGFVKPLLCEVSDAVFGDFNSGQASKVVCWHNSAFQEVTWHYPSSSSIELDRYVSYNYLSDTWTMGSLVRTAVMDRGATQYPMAVGVDGYVYEHEVGGGYDGVTPFVLTGPIALVPPGERRNVDRQMTARYIQADTITSPGEVRVTAYPRRRRMEPPGAVGPFTLSGSQTPVRFTGREVDLKLEFLTAAARAGEFELDVAPRGER